MQAALPSKQAGISDRQDYSTYVSSRNHVLDSIYLTMLDAFLDAWAAMKVAGKLDPVIYRQILPERVLILAAHLGIITPLNDSAEVNGVKVGPYFIDPKDRNEVLKNLSWVIAAGAVDPDATDRWKHPTPLEHVKNFLRTITPQKRKVWDQLDLIKALSKNQHTEYSANKKFLQLWIYNEPAKYSEAMPRDLDRHKNLLEIMTARASLELTVNDLMWTPNV